MHGNYDTSLQVPRCNDVTVMRKRDLCIVDYGMGNLLSVVSALDSLECRSIVSSDPDRISKADALILPGVGAFGEAMERMRALGLLDALEDRVLKAGVPFLGICLGMQLLGTKSTEGGGHEGLGWIDSKVDTIPLDSSIRIPHIGWNEVTWTGGESFNKNIVQGSHFYFNHSFCMVSASNSAVAVVDIGRPLVAAIMKDNIWGVQFHPEKSQNNGRRLLRNFINFMKAG